MEGTCSALLLGHYYLRKGPTAPCPLNKGIQSAPSLYFQKYLAFLKGISGTSLVIQWLTLWAPRAGGLGSIPGQETRSHMPQLKNILHATVKTWHSPINLKKKKIYLKFLASGLVETCLCPLKLSAEMLQLCRVYHQPSQVTQQLQA